MSELIKTDTTPEGFVDQAETQAARVTPVSLPDRQSPYQTLLSMLSPELSGARYTRQMILDCLNVASQLGIVITGSAAWMLQTGLSLEETISLAKDVDGVPKADPQLGMIMLRYMIEEVDVLSPGWETRLVTQRIELNGEEKTLSLVDYHDIGITLCRHVENRKYYSSCRQMNLEEAVDLLRKARALVHMHNFSLGNDGEPGSSFRQEIRTALSNLHNLFGSIRLRPIDSRNDLNLQRQILSAFTKLMEYVN